MSFKDLFKKKKNADDAYTIDTADNWGTVEPSSSHNPKLNIDTDIGDMRTSTEADEAELALLYEKKNLGARETSKDSDVKVKVSDSFLNKKKKKDGMFKLNPFSAIFRKKDVQIETQSMDFDRKSIEMPDKPSSVEDRLSKKTNTNSSMSEGSFEAKQKKIPIIGKYSTRFQVRIMSSLLVLSLNGAITGVYLNNRGSAQHAEAFNLVTKVYGDYEGFGASFVGAAIGREGDLEDTLKSWDELQANYKKIKTYNKGFSGAVTGELGEIEKKLEFQLNKINEKVLIMRDNQDLLKNTAARVRSVQESIGELGDLVDRLGIIYVQVKATKAELANIYFLKGAIQNLYGDISTLFFSEDVPPETLVSLAKNRREIRATLSELYFGAKDRGVNPISYEAPIATYKKLASGWVTFASTVDDIQRRAPDLIKIHKMSKETRENLAKVSTEVNSLLKFYDSNNFVTANNGMIVIVISLLFLLASIAILLMISSFERENKMLEEKMVNNKNQTAILKLLNEMMPLQDGDLTQKTTVSEEITGAIADSVNATIDSLTTLVKKIKDTSLEMRVKTNNMSEISVEMLKAAENQSEEITKTGTAMIDISKAIKEISNKTQKGSETAVESANISTKGAEQVFASLEAMQSINKNIAETVHLMKKVSDSSKQISEIVNLLSDITEETNILALNATVQASKAGEAGKGFKIVADSIQELADNAAEATRKVGVLISAVQTDIQSVSHSVEKTTNEVERGVKLSESAGDALNMIKTVSSDLAQIVQQVSNDALKHARSSEQISKNVEMILDVTKKNKDSTEKTANSINEIAELSNELGDSVQTFKVE